ncbi:TIGR03085 family metal-binding protein [Sanguibacter suaedae]|uniref:TIGR03085 family protein n=1 Tax=Sanguibacter suaedae TaxID=2795737 RepID=A0A934MB52_9MICO|nr:TIGR03085 family metal-binding protein [Sanguibacter suaedae]MBI9114941.1 TIGR03085 family protein [Sanguibacter suaedae]
MPTDRRTSQDTPWNVQERAELVRALTEAGPGAPTLCEGWRTEHLAAHVLLRDRRPWSATPGGIDALAARSRTPEGFAALVADVAEAPPLWAPGRWAGELVNVLELRVHTDDVLLAGPDPTSGRRELSDAHRDALWRQLRLGARLLYARAPVGVVLVVPDGPRAAVRKPPARGGHGTVVVRGQVEELVLHAFGRGASARVVVEGYDEDVAALAERFPGPSSV